MADFRGYKIKYSSKDVIEPEEILLDSKKIEDEEKTDSDLGRMELPIKSRNFIFFLTFVFMCLFFVLCRVAFVQIKDGDFYFSQAKGNAISVLPIKAQRGVIYDNNLKQLVFNQPSFDLVVDKREVENNEILLREISDIAKVSYDDIVKEIQDSKETQVVIAENLSQDAILALETRYKDVYGIKVEKDFRRKYVNGPQFSHIFGFLRRVDADDLKKLKNYYFNDFLGKSGLEQSYEKVLRGTPGEVWTERDALGNFKKEREASQPKDGQSLVLHIDAGLQEKLYSSLLAHAGGKPASAVAIDPRSGGILAIVSLPSFDNNIFSQKVSQEEFKKIDLFNRSIAGIYPSGSTIKPILAVAAIEEKIISPQKTINCQGGIQVGNRIFKDWKTHGVVDMIKAIAQSCNVYFYTIGGGYGNQEGLGLEKIVKYLKLFGWGSISGIDIFGEREGILPAKLEQKADIYSISIGQGDITITPLQVANSYVAIANGGTLYEPHLVDKIIDKEMNVIKTIESKIVRQNFISKEALEIVRLGMREGVISGSSRLLSTLPVEAAGKTGTAQFGVGNSKNHAWFSGFAPYNNPEIVLTIIVEGGGEGSAVSVPVAKEALEWYFTKDKENVTSSPSPSIEPSPEQEEIQPLVSSSPVVSSSPESVQ